ncbi:MAG: acyl-CoA thioesterase [Glaciecola sp.]|jgi:acyl-CoA thioester hydrolase|uniref:acyl-CoA thioesterase n=1 Tax=Glaciecola sp. HTCC2999 TaxID=455436 RepID=UPI000492E832|nr:thioesterase family protein [Glaciecola sp. HTCC2999]MCH1414153.1 acyl-CoA thioesterase [Glaciecola sp.]
MLTETFKIRFYETDALRHVNNTVVPQWFETAREPIFKVFTPELDLANWPLIVASFTVDFVAQIHYGHDVTVTTGIERIGNSSFVVYQELHQQDKLVAKGSTTLVHFDYQTQRSAKIDDSQRAQLLSWKVIPV